MSAVTLTTTPTASAYDDTVRGGGMANINPGQTFTLSLGRFNDSSIPEFRPKVINMRVGDFLQFRFVSPLEPFSIVQAVSAEQPCTEKSGGTYVGAMSSWTTEPDGSRRAVDFGWVMPPYDNDVLYLFSGGHCETEGMRATIYVDSTDWNGVGIATPTPYGYDYGSTAPSSSAAASPGLSAAGKGGVVGGILLIALIVGALVFALVRRNKAKKRAQLHIAPVAQTKDKSGAKVRESVRSVSSEALPPYAESDKAAHDAKDKANLV